MSDAPFEPASDRAINELVDALRPVVASAEGELDLQAILDLPEAKQAIAAWVVQHEIAALGHGGKVAPWLVGSLVRRGLRDNRD